MKVIEILGGLGNQLFEYSYYLYIKKKYSKETVCTFFPNRHVGHNGFELTKWFDVELNEPSWSKPLCGILYWSSRIIRHLGMPVWFIREKENDKENVIFHEGYWQDKKYIVESGILSSLQYKNYDLSEENKKIKEKIQTTNSVSIHIRRGDYLNHPELYGGICTSDYYAKALAKIKENVDDPTFFVFSDDLSFAQSLLRNEEIVVVDCNRGANSFYDMYLVSQCKNMILANSTFSYWAALLNRNHPLVVCPDRWTNIDSPDIILDEWIKIKN